MKEIKLRYFLNGEETQKDLIDWNRSSSMSVKGDIVNVTYMDKTPCGHSLRYKACNAGYEHPNLRGLIPTATDSGYKLPIPPVETDLDKLESDDNVRFYNAAYGHPIKTFKSTKEYKSAVDKILEEDSFSKNLPKGEIDYTMNFYPEKSKNFNKGLERTASADELIKKTSQDISDSLIENIKKQFTNNDEMQGSLFRVYESVKNNNHEGVKEESGKLTYELDWDFIKQMAERMSTNKGKYPPYNWKKNMDVEKLKQAMFRHVIEIMNGIYEDEGRLLGHLESVALNAMMINYQLKNNK